MVHNNTLVNRQSKQLSLEKSLKDNPNVFKSDFMSNMWHAICLAASQNECSWGLSLSIP